MIQTVFQTKYLLYPVTEVKPTGRPLFLQQMHIYRMSFQDLVETEGVRIYPAIFAQFADKVC